MIQSDVSNGDNTRELKQHLQEALEAALLEFRQKGFEPDNGPNRSTARPDQAMMANPGGIDLNPNSFTIENKGESIPFKLPAELQYLENTPIEKFTPVIYQIIPITNFPAFLLGETQKEDSQQLSLVPK